MWSRSRSNKTVRFHPQGIQCDRFVTYCCVSPQCRKHTLEFLPKKDIAFDVWPNVTGLFSTLTKSCLCSVCSDVLDKVVPVGTGDLGWEYVDSFLVWRHLLNGLLHVPMTGRHAMEMNTTKYPTVQMERAGDQMHVASKVAEWKVNWGPNKIFSYLFTTITKQWATLTQGCLELNANTSGLPLLTAANRAGTNK